jgi:Tfp pilus assembly protein PilX
MLRAQQLARQDVKTDKGYAMMMTSIITIMLFSLMGAFLTMTNLAKSSTDAYLDGNNTFYAAESGLNKRAEELRARFENYNSPSDGATTVAEKNEANRKPSSMSSCYGSTTAPTPTSDFECRNYTFTYHNNIARTAGRSADTTVLSEADNVSSSKVDYKAYTFVADNTDYNLTSSVREPNPIAITTGDYIGLNAQEYKYTVNATAAKPKPFCKWTSRVERFRSFSLGLFIMAIWN